MKQKKNEWDNRMMPKDEPVSPSIDEGSSGGLVAGGGRILKKGPWTTAEDAILVDHVKKHGEGNWNAVQKHSGLYRCGKSCRLRWANHLRPNLKKGVITSEEERLIIGLHSKMGNKWARMATHLPGRTDNEIKNYWNTRIKRRFRAGLSPPPSEMCFEAASENLKSEEDEFSDYVRRQNEYLKGFTKDSVTDGILDGSVFTQGFGSAIFSPTNPTGNHVKRHQGSETLLPGFHGSLHQGSETLLPGFHGSLHDGFPTLQQFSTGPTGMIPWSFGSTYPFDPDPGSKNLTRFSGGHALSNGNFSTSRPFTGAVKLELPSLQYTETDVSNWFPCPSATSPDVIDTCIQFPPAAVSVQPDCLNCVSPRNSGLLESLLHESCDLRTTRNDPSEKISSSVLTASGMVETSAIDSCEAGWGNYRDPITPLEHTAASVFCETPPISGISIDGFPPSNEQSGSHDFMANTEHVSTPSAGQIEPPTRLNFVRPDALLGSDWFDKSYRTAKEHSMLSDALAPFLGDDLCDEDNIMPSGTASSAASQELGLESYQWNNIPHVCQLPEIP